MAETLDWQAVRRAARMATDMGHYSVAGLLLGAEGALTNQALYAQALPQTDAGLAEALEALEPGWVAAGLDAGLLEGLQRARAIVAGGGVVHYSDAPALYVCRVCGTVARETRPAHCARCGAGALVQQLFRPTFALDPEPVDVVLEALAATPDWLAQLVAGLSVEAWERPVDGVEGAWSLHAAADHLLGAQYLIARRVPLFLTQSAPNLVGQTPAEVQAGEPLAMDALVARFAQARAEMLAQLRAADATVWERVGQHAEFGPVTLRQQATYFAKHEQWHMAQMTRMRRQV